MISTGRWSGDAFVSLELCMLTDRVQSQEDGEAKDEEMKEEEVKRALVKSIAKGF